LHAGIDSASLYAPDFRILQEWASRIANHPSGFDGIEYHSRHTDERCLVLWSRTTNDVPISKTISFAFDTPFLESEAAYALAGKIAIRLSFAT
jgi:hypothetical protein